MTEDGGCCLTLPVTIAVLACTVLLLYWRRSKARTPSQHPRDTVMLHQLGKGTRAPSLSPFVIKLETYLRMANIPYKNLYDRQMSSKGKTPWIEYNGENVPDSAFCIDFLNNKFGVDLSATYTPEQRAVAWAFVSMLEDSAYWYIGLARCVYDRNHTVFRQIGLSWLIRKILERKAKAAAWYHGIGRHSQKEVELIASRDLQALSTFIGDRKFLLGDTACQEDCAVFGQLAQFVWQLPGSEGEKLVLDKYPNLERYCRRMRARYWPDWDERTLESSS